MKHLTTLALLLLLISSCKKETTAPLTNDVSISTCAVHQDSVLVTDHGSDSLHYSVEIKANKEVTGTLLLVATTPATTGRFAVKIANLTLAANEKHTLSFNGHLPDSVNFVTPHKVELSLMWLPDDSTGALNISPGSCSNPTNVIVGDPLAGSAEGILVNALNNMNFEEIFISKQTIGLAGNTFTPYTAIPSGSRALNQYKQTLKDLSIRPGSKYTFFLAFDTLTDGLMAGIFMYDTLTPRNGSKAYVRFVNILSSDVNTCTLEYQVDQIVPGCEDIAFKKHSLFEPVDPGTFDFKVFNHRSEVGNIDAFELKAGKFYTFYISGNTDVGGNILPAKVITHN